MRISLPSSINSVLLILSFFIANKGLCHPEVSDDHHAVATYLGNSAVLVKSGDTKILFDPFFHNNFGIYRLVPEELHKAVLQGTSPYDNIDAIFISHAHEDHFSVRDVTRYLRQFPNVKLFAPAQAIQQILDSDKAKSSINSEQLLAFSLDFGDAPETKIVENFVVNATRIPHAGWPGRKDVENIVFSVKVKGGKTAMHMGDADPDDDHYLPYKQHWQDNPVDINFPPYWFFTSAEGRDILNKILVVKKNVGVHVPMPAPKYLTQHNHLYLSKPEEKIMTGSDNE